MGNKIGRRLHLRKRCCEIGGKFFDPSTVFGTDRSDALVENGRDSAFFFVVHRRNRFGLLFKRRSFFFVGAAQLRKERIEFFIERSDASVVFAVDRFELLCVFSLQRIDFFVVAFSEFVDVLFVFFVERCQLFFYIRDDIARRIFKSCNRFRSFLRERSVDFGRFLFVRFRQGAVLRSERRVRLRRKLFVFFRQRAVLRRNGRIGFVRFLRMLFGKLCILPIELCAVVFQSLFIRIGKLRILRVVFFYHFRSTAADRAVDRKDFAFDFLYRLGNARIEAGRKRRHFTFVFIGQGAIALLILFIDIRFRSCSGFNRFVGAGMHAAFRFGDALVDEGFDCSNLVFNRPHVCVAPRLRLFTQMAERRIFKRVRFFRSRIVHAFHLRLKANDRIVGLLSERRDMFGEFFRARIVFLQQLCAEQFQLFTVFLRKLSGDLRNTLFDFVDRLFLRVDARVEFFNDERFLFQPR